MKENKYLEYSPLVFRAIVGLMFLVTGITKILNPQGIIGMLGGAGFFWPTAWGWLVILSEILFGALVLAGWKLKYTIWPLVIIMIVATVMVGTLKNPTGLLFHLLTIWTLVSLYMGGGGKYSLDKD